MALYVQLNNDRGMVMSIVARFFSQSAEMALVYLRAHHAGGIQDDQSMSCQCAFRTYVNMFNQDSVGEYCSAVQEAAVTGP